MDPFYHISAELLDLMFSAELEPDQLEVVLRFPSERDRMAFVANNIKRLAQGNREPDTTIRYDQFIYNGIVFKLEAPPKRRSLFR